MSYTDMIEQRNPDSKHATMFITNRDSVTYIATISRIEEC